MKLTHKLYAYAGVAAASTSLLLAAPTFADSSPVDSNGNGFGPAGSADFSPSAQDLKTPIAGIGNTIINVVFLLAAIIAILYLVYSGIQYITSAGNTEKTKIARMGVINSIIGIIIIAAAYGIIRFALSIGSGFTGTTATI